MAPNIKEVIGEGGSEVQGTEFGDLPKVTEAAPREYTYVYSMCASMIYIHLSGFYGLYLCFTSAKWATIYFNFILLVLASIGVTAGAHRLWSHRAFKAKLPLQILLIIMQSISYQFTAFYWVKEHRLHHRYSDTDADPHNASRGFFFSHMGWLCVMKHPEVKKRGQATDLSDMYANPVIMFQKRHAILMIGSCAAVLPTIIPMYFWGESLNIAWHVCVLRFMLNLHGTFSINSVAHMFGTKPYNKTIRPVQSSFVSVVSFGEGYHNYHHTYPWDYKAAELGTGWFNLTRLFIELFAWIGWAYDLKTVPKDVVQARALRTGDGTYVVNQLKNK